MTKINYMIVSRHPALLSFLIERGLVGEETLVLSHATPEQVRGRHVFGVLPLRLAAEASKITEIQLNVPEELRGKELTLDQMRQFAGAPATYRVIREPQETMTVPQLVGMLGMGKSVIARSGQRGQLVGALKRGRIHTHAKTLPDGQVAFVPCPERKFK